MIVSENTPLGIGNIVMKGDVTLHQVLSVFLFELQSLLDCKEAVKLPTSSRCFLQSGPVLMRLHVLIEVSFECLVIGKHHIRVYIQRPS